MISDEDLERLKERLEGTCESLSTALRCLEIEADIAVVKDRLLDGDSTEKCGCCGWWLRGTGAYDFNEKYGGPLCYSCDKHEDEDA